MNGALFFHEGYRAENVRGVSDRIDETNFL